MDAVNNYKKHMLMNPRYRAPVEVSRGSLFNLANNLLETNPIPYSSLYMNARGEAFISVAGSCDDCWEFPFARAGEFAEQTDLADKFEGLVGLKKACKNNKVEFN